MGMPSPHRSVNQMMGWPDKQPPFPTSLVERVERACATPLRDLTPAQLALLLRQKVAPAVVLPNAIAALYENPLGDAYYGLYGDLLCAALMQDHDVWNGNENLWRDLHSLLEQIDAANEAISEARKKFSAWLS